MRYLLSATILLQMLFGPACLSQMLPAQETSATPAVEAAAHNPHEDCTKATIHEEQPDFSCLSHCLAQATDRATGAVPLQCTHDAGIFALPILPPCVLTAEEDSLLPEVLHPSLSPPATLTVVLRQ